MEPFTHMPSGVTGLTSAIYEVTEHHPISSPLARQLLHLACHAENIPHLLAARDQHGVILDRWWWSTMAYGWFGGQLGARITQAAFRSAIDLVWAGMHADLVFLFLTSYRPDHNNTEAVAEGYRWLSHEYPDQVVEVPPDDPQATTAFLLEQLDKRHLLG